MGKKFVFKNNEPLNKLVSYILKKKDLEAILLNGELGAGKTTLVNAIAKKLGEKKPVISPTFNTILIYDNLVHIDAYKLKGSLFPYQEYFENKLVAVEWAENIINPFTKYMQIDVYFDEKGNHVFEIVKE